MGYNFDEKVVPSIDRDSCSCCGECADVCPTETLALEDGEIVVGSRTFMDCVACGQCMAVCLTESITVTGRRLEPDDLIELPPGAERATADQLESLLLARRSVRRFTEQEVDHASIEQIVRMTAAAPMGIPPSEVGIVVYNSREKVRQFCEDSVAWFKKCAGMFNPVVLLLMRPFIGKAQHAMMRDFAGPLMQLIAERWDQGQDVFTYDAPLVLLFHCGPGADPADAQIAATYAMLAAESFGVGNCMLGGAVACKVSVRCT